jgi:hypothetical protein
MEPAAIVNQLMTSQRLPTAALHAAGEHRAALVPRFIEEIESYVKGGDADDNLLFFAFHLLGSWKETAAYGPFARLLRCDPDRIDLALGLSVSETAHRVMAAVFDGNPEPIYNIILDRDADEFARSRMCETLAMLVLEERLDRNEVAAFLRDCWINLQPREMSFAWNGWQRAIAMLGLVELREIVKEAFDRRFIDPQLLRYEHFEHDLTLALLNSAEPSSRFGKEYAALGDPVEELSGWYELSREYSEDRTHDLELPPLFPAPEPVINPLRGIGRNDPCPCGSGRKYKKCCLQ